MTQEAFKTWWYNEGSQAPYTHHDCEEHTMRMCEIAWNKAQSLAQPEQEPVAWLHTKIEGVAVPHRPADLDKHPDRWEALYKAPPPCQTCEALARTVMLDQTSHDTTPPQRTWVGLMDDEIQKMRHLIDWTAGWSYNTFARAVEAKLKEKNT